MKKKIVVEFTFEEVIEDGEVIYHELVEMNRTVNEIGYSAEGIGEQWAQSDNYHVDIAQDLIGVVSDGDKVKYDR